MIIWIIAVKIWVLLTKDRILPSKKKISARNTIVILNILEPKIFPRPISISPIFTADMETTISGREVEIAKKILPTNVWPKLVIMAILSANLVRVILLMIIIRENIEKIIIFLKRLLLEDFAIFSILCLFSNLNINLVPII
jgi:hypothetical protein